MWYVGQTIQSEGDGERMEAITASQLRAARGLLGLSQRDLAALSKVSRATIADFEAGKRQPYPRTLADLQRSLEAAGVAFMGDDELIGVKIRRLNLASRPAVVATVRRPAAQSDRQAPAEKQAALPRRRLLSRVAEDGVTPEQIKAGRELLGWSPVDLANQVGVSETAISLFEREKRRLLSVDTSQLRAALEAAGVEFTDESGSGVRLRAPPKPKTPEIPLEEFLSQLEWYEQNRLRPKGISLGGKQGVKYGFALLYLDRASASLMLDGRELGRVKWSDGEIAFEPPVPLSDRSAALEESFAQWAAAAYARSLAGSEPRPVQNLRQFVPRPDDRREAQTSTGAPWLKRDAPPT